MMISIPRVSVMNMNTFFIRVVFLKDEWSEKRLQGRGGFISGKI
jgi:hypothetical protein